MLNQLGILTSIKICDWIAILLLIVVVSICRPIAASWLALNIIQFLHYSADSRDVSIDLPSCLDPTIYSMKAQVASKHTVVRVRLNKNNLFNVGRSALPLRLIEDSELTPFASKKDIKDYLSSTKLCDVMFCSPSDINMKANKPPV